MKEKSPSRISPVKKARKRKKDLSELAETASFFEASGLSVAGLVVGSGPGIVDDKLASVEFGPAEPVLGLRGGFGGRHLDETETSSLQNVDRDHLTVLGKQLFQCVLSGLVVEVADIKFLRHKRNLLDLSPSPCPIFIRSHDRKSRSIQSQQKGQIKSFLRGISISKSVIDQDAFLFVGEEIQAWDAPSV
jgi:hypothetical protein